MTFDSDILFNSFPLSFFVTLFCLLVFRRFYLKHSMERRVYNLLRVSPRKTVHVLARSFRIKCSYGAGIGWNYKDNSSYWA